MKEYILLDEDERLALEKNFLEDPDSFYKKAEEDRIKGDLKKSYTERFLTMTRLMKMGLMLAKAKITHGSFSPSK